MRRLLTTILGAAVALLLAGSAPISAADKAPAFGKALVIYFSLSGKTGGLAESIAAKTGAELYQVETVEPLPADEKELIAYEEARRKAGTKVEVKGPPPNIDGYDLVFVGSPTWFGEPPEAVIALLSQVDFKGAKVAVFATAGTRPGNTVETLKASIKNGQALEPTLLQVRADDQSEAAVAQRVDAFLAEVAKALKP
jgi:flavodoxin